MKYKNKILKILKYLEHNIDNNLLENSMFDDILLVEYGYYALVESNVQEALKHVMDKINVIFNKISENISEFLFNIVNAFVKFIKVVLRVAAVVGATVFAAIVTKTLILLSLGVKTFKDIERLEKSKNKSLIKKRLLWFVDKINQYLLFVVKMINWVKVKNTKIIVYFKKLYKEIITYFKSEGGNVKEIKQNFKKIFKNNTPIKNQIDENFIIDDKKEPFDVPLYKEEKTPKIPQKNIETKIEQKKVYIN